MQQITSQGMLNNILKGMGGGGGGGGGLGGSNLPVMIKKVT